MTLKEQIEKDIITAMKEKNAVKRDILKFVKAQIQIAETEKNAKEVNNGKVVKIIEKIIENAEVVGNDESKAQIEILKTYLPTKMTEAEIRTEVEAIFNGGANNIGAIMRQFNSKFAGKADNKIVKSIADELLG